MTEDEFRTFASSLKTCKDLGQAESMLKQAIDTRLAVAVKMRTRADDTSVSELIRQARAAVAMENLAGARVNELKVAAYEDILYDLTTWAMQSLPTLALGESFKKAIDNFRKEHLKQGPVAPSEPAKPEAEPTTWTNWVHVPKGWQPAKVPSDGRYARGAYLAARQVHPTATGLVEVFVPCRGTYMVDVQRCEVRHGGACFHGPLDKMDEPS